MHQICSAATSRTSMYVMAPRPAGISFASPLYILHTGLSVSLSCSGFSGKEIGGPVTTPGRTAEQLKGALFSSCHFHIALSAAVLDAPYATGAENSFRATASPEVFQSASV